MLFRTRWSSPPRPPPTCTNPAAAPRRRQRCSSCSSSSSRSSNSIILSPFWPPAGHLRRRRRRLWGEKSQKETLCSCLRTMNAVNTINFLNTLNQLFPQCFSPQGRWPWPSPFFPLRRWSPFGLLLLLPPHHLTQEAIPTEQDSAPHGAQAMSRLREDAAGEETRSYLKAVLSGCEQVLHNVRDIIRGGKLWRISYESIVGALGNMLLESAAICFLDIFRFATKTNKKRILFSSWRPALWPAGDTVESSPCSAGEGRMLRQMYGKRGKTQRSEDWRKEEDGLQSRNSKIRKKGEARFGKRNGVRRGGRRWLQDLKLPCLLPPPRSPSLPLKNSGWKEGRNWRKKALFIECKGIFENWEFGEGGKSDPSWNPPKTEHFLPHQLLVQNWKEVDEKGNFDKMHKYEALQKGEVSGISFLLLRLLY